MKKSQNDFELDKDFSQIGDIGPYQLLVLFLVGFTAIIPAYYSHGYVFVSGTPEYRCKIPGFGNDTFAIQSEYHQELIDKNIPIVNSSSPKYDKCNLKVSNNSDETDIRLEKCRSWVFSDEYYGKTITTDVEYIFYFEDPWQLICDDTTWKSTLSSMLFIGSVGVILVGFISDKFGRKRCAYGLVVINALANILIAIIVNVNIHNDIKIYVYAVIRVLNGLTSTMYSIAVVLAVEIMGTKYRVFAANSIYYFYIFGEYLTVGLSYFIRDYDNLFICFAAIIGCFPFYFWLIPESPRWQLTRGQKKEAYKTLKRIANSNGKQMPETYETLLSDFPQDKTNSDGVQEREDEKPIKFGFWSTVWQILKSKKLLFCTIAMSFNWLTNSLVYYGISLGTGQLAGNPYLNFTLLATTELVAIVVSQFAFQKIGRKIPYVVNMGIAGLSMFLVYFLPKSNLYLVTIFAVIGKFTISLTYGGVYIVTSEMYPTVVRNTALSLCQVISRFGSILSPYINLLGEIYFHSLPFMIYGTSAILASVLFIFFIPETNKKDLPDTLKDMDE